MQRQKHIALLERCVEISRNARNHGNTPFGALLTDSKGNILLEQENIEITEQICTGHAETSLAAKASTLYSKEFLWQCKLYTTAEPYALTEKRLLELTGDNEQNPTFDLPAQQIIDRGQKPIQIIGPFPEVEEKARKVHEGYWK